MHGPVPKDSSALCQEEYCKVTTQTRDHEFITAQVVIQCLGTKAL